MDKEIAKVEVGQKKTLGMAGALFLVIMFFSFYSFCFTL